MGKLTNKMHSFQVEPAAPRRRTVFFRRSDGDSDWLQPTSIELVKSQLPDVEALVSNAAEISAIEILVNEVKRKHGRIDVLPFAPATEEVRMIALSSDINRVLQEKERSLHIEIALGIEEGRSLFVPDAHCAHPLANDWTEGAVPISDQIGRC